jgi:heme exporter protein C
MNFSWFYKLGSPKWFYSMTTSWVKPIGILSLALMIIAFVWGLAYAPADYLQGNSYRIIFIHVPSAFLAESIYCMLAVCAFLFFIWRVKLTDVFLESLAPIGASFCLLALVTGAIWGKPTWGTWWVWDARLTSMLILLFLYLGIIAFRQAATSRKNADRGCAILTVVGAINIPIIKFSVDWWNTLHQGATLKITGASTIATEMLHPLLLSIVAFYLFFVFVLLLRVRNNLLLRESKTKWVNSLFIPN